MQTHRWWLGNRPYTNRQEGGTDAVKSENVVDGILKVKPYFAEAVMETMQNYGADS